MYTFRTHCYMKDYNQNKYFIISDYVDEIVSEADDLDAAIDDYRTALDDTYGITISNNAVKNKDALFDRDGDQVGYIFTGSSDFRTDDYSRPYTKQYIDVCTRIYKQLKLEF